MMDETGTAGCVKQFTLELYGSEGVPATCLYLQNQRDESKRWRQNHAPRQRC